MEAIRFLYHICLMEIKRRRASIPIEILPIDELGFHLCVQVSINRKKYRLVLDTGASRTVFDQEEIKKIVKEGTTEIEGKLSAGLGTNQMQTHSVILKQFKVGKIQLPGFEALALDLAVLNASYEQMGHGTVIGVLGSDILHAHQALIDFGKKRLTLFYEEKESPV